MRRITLLVVLILSAMLFTAIININQASKDVRAFHDHHAEKQGAGQKKEPVVDGALAPDAIPDHAALALVFRILSSDEPDAVGDRKKAYLTHYGFNADAQAALMLAARDFKRLMAPIDAETKRVKDLTWPNPDENARNQLKDLQRNKEAAIAGIAYELNGKLANFGVLGQWTDHLANTVKRKTKGFGVELPGKKVGFFELFPDPFAVYAQGGGCDPVYTYADLLESNLVMYGYTSYDAGANNCGHEFYPTTRILNNSVQVASGVDSAAFDLYNPVGFYYDGSFTSVADLDAYCPVIQQFYDAGQDGVNTFRSANVVLGPYHGCSPAGNVGVNVTYNCFLIATGSNDSGGKSFTISVNHEIVSGVFTMVNTPSATSGTFPNNGPNQPKQFTIGASHKPTALGGSSAQFRGVTNIGSTTLQVFDSPRKSATKTIVP